ncbi:ATP-grasp domain-containing protein [Streptomyces sp. LMG1-1-1.1]|uniref:ATP-grasp domain-containing protein n=1 Tax=Streptomyces sp. LMG1-1-1.1 TaxID=3135245 RepID=UPI0034673CCE
MGNSWLVSVELHTLPGGARELASAGDRLTAPSQQFLAAARARGHRTAVVAADRSFYGSAFDDLVDAWLITDTSSPEHVGRMLVALSGEVAAVHSSVDSFVGVAASVARQYGLPGPAPDGAAIRRDKSAARAAMARAGVEDVRWATQPADAEAPSSPIGYPCVVKPVDGASSWDVALVESDEEVAAVARNHMARSYGRGVRPRRTLLFEEVLNGPVFSAEGFVDADELTVFGYSDRVMTEPPYFVELALRFAAEPPCPGAEDFVRDTLRALDYDFGPFHLEFVLTEDGPRLLETNARLVGAGMQQAIGYVSGLRPAEVVVAKLTGAAVPALTPDGAVTELRITSPVTGRLRGVTGLEAAAAAPGCRSVGMYVEPGEAVSADVHSNSQRVGYVQAVGGTREDSYRNALAAAALIELDVDTEAV